MKAIVLLGFTAAIVALNSVQPATGQLAAAAPQDMYDPKKVETTLMKASTTFPEISAYHVDPHPLCSALRTQVLAIIRTMKPNLGVKDASAKAAVETALADLTCLSRSKEIPTKAQGALRQAAKDFNSIQQALLARG